MQGLTSALPHSNAVKYVTGWKPKQRAYPHFDAPLSKIEMERIANDPDRVARNSFFPFLKYEKKFRPFRPNGKEPKVREIRYGSHRDSAIFSRYRHELSECYERLLEDQKLSPYILAYRHIPVQEQSSSGKSNIHHAKDVFDRIEKYVNDYGNCCAIALDISAYFENLDHDRLKEIWCRLLDKDSLPDDHFSVFRAITKYAVVEVEDAYEALGYFSKSKGYLVKRKDMPRQLCSPKDFRDKICGKVTGSNLIKQNKKDRGIPQGAPLSDLLANAYLIDFDQEMVYYARSFNGHYMRYSDDILFVAPISESQACCVMNYAQNLIRNYGESLEINANKCAIDQFIQKDTSIEHQPVYPKGKQRNGLNYLGFRFDGKRVFLRDSTVSNFRRKMTRAVNAHARDLVKEYAGKDIAYLESKLNTDAIIEKFGRVRDFDQKNSKKSWTFWTYVKRANKVFGKKSRIYGQVSGYKKAIRELSTKALKKYI